MTVLDQASPTEAVQSTVQEPASEPIDSEAVVAVVMDFVGATHIASSTTCSNACGSVHAARA